MSDETFYPEFDRGDFRYAVARYVKLLIHARWKHDPGFLSDEALRAWNLPNINKDPYPSWRLLEMAAEAPGILNTEYIDRCPSGGIQVMTEDTPEERLCATIAFLTFPTGGGPYHNFTLLRMAEIIREDRPIDWDSLVSWSWLPAIRTDLDKLPDPKSRTPERQGQEASSPRTPRSPSRFFPKMDGLRWEEVTIAFVSNDSIRITARKKSDTFMFSDIGFRDGRKNNMPDTQWKLLKLMAQHSGELSWSGKIPAHIKDAAKPKIKIIRQRLKKVLHIVDDPFQKYSEVKSYKPRFTLVDQSFSPEQFDENPRMED